MSANEEEPKCKTLFTFGYGYRQFFHLSPVNDWLSVKFSVMARSDAHVLLSPSSAPEDTDPVYEIVIGAGRNSFSDIRRRRLTDSMSATDTEDILSGTEMRGFWVKMNSEGLIEVGREGEDLPFMQWQDPDPLQIQYFSFSSWNDVAGKWIFDCPSDNQQANEEEPKCKTLFTFGYGYRQFFHLSPVNDWLSVKFSVMARSDAHVLLSPTSAPEDTDPVYEIVIGAGRNSFSDIRRRRLTDSMSATDTEDILSGTEMRGFWVKMNSEGLIEVGREGEDLPFIQWQDPDPLQIQYFSFSSWNDVAGKWIFDCPSDNQQANEEEPKCKTLFTFGYGYRQFFHLSPVNDWLSVKFSVMARSDAHVLLSPTSAPEDTDPVYEIVIGAGRNSFSDIRRRRLTDSMSATDTEDILSGTEMRGFWVKMNSEGLIEVGREGEDLPFIQWQDPDPLQIQYFSFSSWNDVAGKWIFDCPSDNQQVQWTSGISQIPPGAVVVGHDKDGSSLYAGRAPHESDVLPAMVKPNQQVAYVSWGGAEHPKQDYEMMVSHNVSWQSTCDGHIPARAVVVGQTAGGEPLYMGRANFDGTLTPGKVQPSHGCLYIPYAGTEVPVGEYEIMVVNVAPTPAVYPETDKNDAGSNIH